MVDWSVGLVEWVVGGWLIGLVVGWLSDYFVDLVGWVDDLVGWWVGSLVGWVIE